MSQSLVKIYIHLVYSTKNRQLWLPKAHQEGLWAYQAGIFEKWECPAIAIGGTDDHIHALFCLSKNLAPKEIVEQVKKSSSHWMKVDGPRNAAFAWQAGYAAFSVSQSAVEEVTHYIQNQEEHHRKMTFQDELRALFRRYNVAFDERYVWD
jgi:REP element-mobilizing transposase RayT